MEIREHYIFTIVLNARQMYTTLNLHVKHTEGKNLTTKTTNKIVIEVILPGQSLPAGFDRWSPPHGQLCSQSAISL